MTLENFFASVWFTRSDKMREKQKNSQTYITSYITEFRRKNIFYFYSKSFMNVKLYWECKQINKIKNLPTIIMWWNCYDTYCVLCYSINTVTQTEYEYDNFLPEFSTMMNMTIFYDMNMTIFYSMNMTIFYNMNITIFLNINMAIFYNMNTIIIFY